MEVNLLLAALAGLAGAVVMTVFIYLFKIIGINLDIPWLIGTWFIPIEEKTKAYFTGIILHLILGGIWGVFYVFSLTAMAATPNWPAGILYGVAHGIFVGAMIGILSANHPNIGEDKAMSDPGMFGSRWGTGIPPVLLAIHIIYGVTTLLIYHSMVAPSGT